MNKFERVLSDAELISATFKAEVEGTMGELRAVEQAVLARLAEQEPIVYLYGDEAYGASSGDISDYIRANGTPLYAHPMPCVSNASDKTACVSENGGSDTQHHIEYIKRYQNWRRGEDKTMSEAGITPKQLGESVDWLIAFTENHIADKRK